MDLGRFAKHLFAPRWVVARAFARSSLAAIERAIGESENTHDGELRFAVEAGLHPRALLKGQSARQRAAQVFSDLRVWDTEHNSGILIYVQLVDRRIEVIADRGISARVAQAEWDAICRGMQSAFRERRYEQGALEAIAQATRLLALHFPPRDANPNELPDAPVVL